MDGYDNNKRDEYGATTLLRLYAVQHTLAETRGDMLLAQKYEEQLCAEDRRITALFYADLFAPVLRNKLRA